jgi:beta-alanine degradation protein BauB
MSNLDTSQPSPFSVEKYPTSGVHTMIQSKATPIAPANSFDRWPPGMVQEMLENAMNPIVGSTLVSETDKIRVWHLLIPPGKRCTFHRHVLDYFWTCHTNGTARGFFEDGSITETVHFPGDTRHMTYGKGEHLVHSVENVGKSDLLFTTVEYKQSANAPLPVPDEVRLKAVA